MEIPDAIAILLAARHDPEIRLLADYLKAETLLETDSELRARFEAERAYYEHHEDLLAGVRLPDDARASIQAKLREAQEQERKVIDWPKRALTFAAAAAVLVMVGALITTRLGSDPEVVAESGLEFEALQSFVAEQVALQALDLDQHSNQPTELIAWLQGRGAPVGDNVPALLESFSSLGCKVYDWNGQQVALVCFRSSANEVVHLFVADRAAFDIATAERQAGTRKMHDRETRSWLDGQLAYVLVAHDEGQSLSGLSG